MSLYPSDIEIHVHLHEDGNINSKALLQALDTLETSLYASDRQDIEFASIELDVPAVVRDACLERLRRYRHDRLILTGDRHGSIEIIGVVAGISYFVLNKTIVESFKKGYEDTELHNNMRQFFKKSIDDKALFISENLRRVFANRKKDVNIKALSSSENKSDRIIIDISSEPKSKKKMQIRSLGEELDNDRTRG